MTQSIYSFERTELRVLQSKCEGDNEKFLNLVADIVGKLTQERDQLKYDLGMAKDRIIKLENGED